ncbi:hypothetical protein MRX96_023822 [Rhipicephalus microplus]
MITATLCHVLLPLVQTVCTVAPTEHAPSFYHFPNQIAVRLVLASPEERISTPYEGRLQPSLDSASKGTLSNGMHRGANGACAIILPLPKSDCRSPCLGFAGGTHIDTLIVDAQVIMGFRIERDTVKFANYKGAATITTTLWARWFCHNPVF